MGIHGIGGRVQSQTGKNLAFRVAQPEGQKLVFYNIPSEDWWKSMTHHRRIVLLILKILASSL